MKKGNMQLQKPLNIVLVAHKFLTQPDDDFVTYLNGKKYANVLHICHSFSDAKDRKSYYSWYRNGKLYKEYFSTDYRFLPEPLVYVKELYFTLLWVASSKVRWHTYIGMDGLCVLFGTLLKKMGKISKTIYWAIDFVPKDRFTSKWKNNIYHMININGYKNADEMWDLSPRMA